MTSATIQSTGTTRETNVYVPPNVTYVVAPPQGTIVTVTPKQPEPRSPR